MSGSQDPLVVDERAAAELSRPRGHGPDHGGQPGPLVRIGVLAPDDLGLEAFRVDPAGWKASEKTDGEHVLEQDSMKMQIARGTRESVPFEGKGRA